jgi:polysaccharide biosynthesis/export protein
MKRNVLWLLILTVCLIQTLAAQEDATTPSSRGYLLGPGDQITAKVLGESQFDFEAVVNEDGKLEIPYLDEPINAMCKSEREVRAEVTKALSKYLRAPKLSLNITERKSRPPVIVGGEVRKPLEVTMYRKARLLELISAAGDLTPDAGGMIKIYRTRAPICGEPEEINEWAAQAANNGGVVTGLYSYSNLRTGTPEANPVIYPGDQIIALRAAPVYFTGELKSSDNLRIPEGGLSLFRAISMLGGLSREAKSKDIKIYRLKPDSMERDLISVNFDKIKKGEQKDVMLEPYDIVEVDRAKPGILSTLLKTVTGAAMGAPGSLVTGGLSRIVMY